jgi:hypothetical protein
MLNHFSFYSIMFSIYTKFITMPIVQSEIDKLKEDFTNITNTTAEDNPIDFYAYLHLLENNRIEKLTYYLELNSIISHKPTWAEMKNYLDEENEQNLY